MRRLEQDRAKRQNRHFRVRHAIVSRHYPSIGWKQEEGKKKYALWSKIPFSGVIYSAVASSRQTPVSGWGEASPLAPQLGHDGVASYRV